ncbi:hypothetical protein DEU56DRAFT_79738 [Suillus clintonianus]|uniref:uncharacterized protein n=1 Tax=Suillus clintonianus TaxID=1904413 RepID=UPI001B884380|nr:uncharacterized protein DEU56DRAFT_79738 [Suillus clintonianus]KAG2148767.1 hypothetical protein DEU56DRAFT_79738 [Suillus clintonianus]
MHQVLLISEILLNIFTYANERSGDSGSITRLGEKSLTRKSLSGLARTCKAFHEPAMDVLWADLCSLEPLLGCVTRLHPLIYSSAKGYWDKGIEPLSAHEGRQFLRHSARVRSLTILSNCHFHLLSAIPLEACVFPRLQSFTWTWIRGHSDKYLNLFLAHTLLHCSLPVISEDLNSIGTRCAALQSLFIEVCDKVTTDQLSLLSDSVRLCGQLVTLYCPPLDWAAWKHLSNQPTLLRVRINQAYSDRPWLFKQGVVNFSPFVFLNITTLSFRRPDAAYIITIMQHSQFPTLKEFKMEVDAISTPEAEQLFRALSNCNACRTLEKIVILNLFHTGRISQETPENSSTAITHFLCFAQLQTLQLMLYGFRIYLDNDLLLEAMSCWPHMRDLQIYNSGHHPSTVTVSGLFTALRQCPHLYSLRVLIDTADIDIDPTAESIQHTSLQILNLDTLQDPIVGAEALALIIFTRFPCIDEVKASMDSCWADWIWEEVNDHLTSLKDAALHVTGAASPT